MTTVTRQVRLAIASLSTLAATATVPVDRSLEEQRREQRSGVQAVLGTDVVTYHRAVIDYATMSLFLHHGDA